MPVRVVSSIALALPADAVDLAAWLRGLTDDDYRAASRAHLGFGHTRRGAREGVTAVEALGGAFIVNRHTVEHAEPHAFRARSPASRAYVLRLVPLPLDLTWEMAVTADAVLECALTVTLPLGLERAARPFLARILQGHADEETRWFAADIARKQAR